MVDEHGCEHDWEITHPLWNLEVLVNLSASQEQLCSKDMISWLKISTVISIYPKPNLIQWFGFLLLVFIYANGLAFTYRQHIYLIEIRINCCPLSKSCCWKVAWFFLCSFWYLSHIMCVHMKCEEIIQVLFTPLASKDEKFTASLKLQKITTAYIQSWSLYFMMMEEFFRNLVCMHI